MPVHPTSLPGPLASRPATDHPTDEQTSFDWRLALPLPSHNDHATNEERRQDPRREVHSRCRVYLNTEKNGARTKARPVNVSRGGALVASPIPLEQGHQVALVVESGSLALRCLAATVRRVVPESESSYLLGLQFELPLDPQQTQW